MEFPQNRLEWCMWQIEERSLLVGKSCDYYVANNDQRWVIAFGYETMGFQHFDEAINGKHDDAICYFFKLTKRELHQQMKKYNAMSDKKSWYFTCKKDADAFVINFLEPLMVAKLLLKNS